MMVKALQVAGTVYVKRLEVGRGGGGSWEHGYCRQEGLTGPMLMQCVNWSSALICSRHSSIAQDLSHVLCQDSYTLPMATQESETKTATV